ncbi:AraC-like DNA-binding protein [Runella defluvii]|uniref:AraC-like DNA-binding protein n=1 Tax=Runella defluvii TaxID=370973 RepID=A0A7W5ZMK1_9BACT|nr:hypothetical protein [Runella defluvii]MBB3840172.1 AraC-like DNA-binding protein [Runella defluvii]
MIEIFDNIRKLYDFARPCVELADFVEFYSETSPQSVERHIDTESFSVKLFPSFTPTLWINLGEEYYLKGLNSNHSIAKNRDVLVLRGETLERIVRYNDRIFTIKFHPLGFERIFGYSQARIGEGKFGADDILGENTVQKLKAMSGLGEKVKWIEAILLHTFHQNKKSSYYLTPLQQSIEQYIQSDFSSKMHQISTSLCLTEKTFYRQFQSVIGTNPRYFFSILRCRSALTCYQNDRANFSPFAYGYYDWGHFSKEIQVFTGQKLSLYGI